ncbi:MAG: hypothetical protein ACYS47_19455 [Planctomycetota bacterium]|jgi:hypothetical protein
MPGAGKEKEIPRAIRFVHVFVHISVLVFVGVLVLVTVIVDVLDKVREQGKGEGEGEGEGEGSSGSGSVIATRENRLEDSVGACTRSNWWKNFRKEPSGPGPWPGRGRGSKFMDLGIPKSLNKKHIPFVLFVSFVVGFASAAIMHP